MEGDTLKYMNIKKKWLIIIPILIIVTVLLIFVWLKSGVQESQVFESQIMKLGSIEDDFGSGQGRQPYFLHELRFFEKIEDGTRISVDPHHEYISFGENIFNLTMAPVFWQLTIDPVANTVPTELHIVYDQENIDYFKVDESVMSIYLYDMNTKIWTKHESRIDVVANTIVTIIDDFDDVRIGIGHAE